MVVNTSGTLPAALSARRTGGATATCTLSTPVPGEEERGARTLDPSKPAHGDEPGLRWVVELRQGDEHEPLRHARMGERLALPAGAVARLEAHYLGSRLWVASLSLPEPLPAYARRPCRARALLPQRRAGRVPEPRVRRPRPLHSRLAAFRDRR